MTSYIWAHPVHVMYYIRSWCPSEGRFFQTETMRRSHHSPPDRCCGRMPFWWLRWIYHPVLRSLTHNALWVGHYGSRVFAIILSPLASTPLTCAPLAAVECLPSAAHLLPFRFLLRLHLLAGHVAAEAGLDLGGGLVGLGVVQGDVHDVLLLLLGPAALLLLQRAARCQGQQYTRDGTRGRARCCLHPSVLQDPICMASSCFILLEMLTESMSHLLLMRIHFVLRIV